MVTISPPWAAVHDTPNKSIRQDVARRGVVLHHAAMTSLSALRDMEVNGTKEVSSTAICKDDAIELVVSDNRYRPWSLASSYWDSAMRSVETCNESTTGWTVSDKSHWSLARAVAYWSQTDGFWPHRDGDPSTWTVIGHREVYSIHDASYSTACPGGLDLDLVVSRAQSILNGGFLMALTDAQQSDLYAKTRALYDATFMQTSTSRGTPQGVLGTLGLIYKAVGLGADVDEAAVAAALAPLVVGPIIAALGDAGVSITTEQVEAAAESAVKRVFADAGN